MEEAIKKQALDMDNVIRQNRELGNCLVKLEKLWVAEEQFTMELRGRVEALQVRSFLQGVLASFVDNKHF